MEDKKESKNARKNRIFQFILFSEVYTRNFL